MDQVLQEFSQRIASATQSGTPLRFRGGGTKDWYGQSLQGEGLDTRLYRDILAYEPTELVITARCGTPLTEIEQTLAENNQMLAFEPPHFGAEATVGGMLACGLSGPGRSSAGAVRDFVLGASLIDGKGEIMHFGGQVMKNVAGYDVSRLLAGSLGTLGLIVQASLKVMPRPAASSSRSFELDEASAIRRLNEWAGMPLPITASAWAHGVLTIRLAGAVAAVEAAEQRLGGEAINDADGFWHALKEQTHPFFMKDERPLWRLSLPSVAPPLELPGQAGEPLIEWGGAQRWIKTELDAVSIRNAAQRAGGHASLFRGGDKSAGVFHPLPPTVAAIHRRLKSAFDPAGIFNPGRMYADW